MNKYYFYFFGLVLYLKIRGIEDEELIEKYENVGNVEFMWLKVEGFYKDYM